MSGELGSALSDEWGISLSLHLSMMGLTFLYSKGKLKPHIQDYLAYLRVVANQIIVIFQKFNFV